MIAKLILAFACLYACSAHLCMLSPPQRTPLDNINKPGSDSCILTDLPCGMTKPSMNKVFLQGGSNFTVVFQKNLDHWNSASPGYLGVFIGQNGTFTKLYVEWDTSLPSLTLYQVVVTIPKNMGTNPQEMVMQTRYVTNNPNAPAIFYQCADVVVM